MLSPTTSVPEPLKRYPRVNAYERASLHQWLKSLSKRHLVALLAEPDLEPKLVALKCEELAADADSMPMETNFLIGSIVFGVAALGVAAVTFLPV